nr:Na/Pi symporter [Chitinophagaceae bacterium]
MSTHEFWYFLAGIALFILGIGQLEEALRGLAGRSFKLFLRRNSSHPLRAILSGTVVTMVLQSSSVVNLLVLAFVGAGLIGMQNGLALILGANLGTTATSWLIALVGFELNIEQLFLPMVGIAGILYAAFSRQSVIGKWLLLLLGFGLMFTGLGFIRESMDALLNSVQLSRYAGYHPAVFLLMGFVLTSLIQASSATMAITLSALATGQLGLVQAMAIALGSEVGTTLKVVLAAVGGTADKKRVALGNFLFNLVSTLAFLLVLEPVAHFIQQTLGVQSNLFALVVFQTLVNAGGILIFLPILGPVGRWLNHRFRTGARRSLFISQQPVADPDIAIDMLRNEVLSLMQHALIFCRHLFGENIPDHHKDFYHREFETLSLEKQYEFIKIQHGETFDFYIRLQGGNLQPAERVAAERLIAAARNAVYAAKSFKDTIADVEEFSASGKDRKYAVFEETRTSTISFTASMESLLFETSLNKAADLLDFYARVQRQYHTNISHIYA